MKKLRVTVDGRVFDVIVEMADDAAGAPRTMAAPATPAVQAAAVAAAPAATPTAPVAPAAGGAGAVPSPLAGKVVSIDVKLGETVKEGTQLVTLEAMKMNTFVYASRSGVVAAINVKPGEAVEEGTALLVVN